MGGVDSQGNPTFHAFSYINGTATDLGTLGGYNSEATAINASGEIAGDSDTSGGGHDAFAINNGKMIDLGSFGGISLAEGINSEGDIVGMSNYPGGALLGFVYEDGQMFDLNNLIPVNSGWEITYGLAINDSGDILAAGYNGSVSGALLLTPVPEPSCAALVLGGTVGWCCEELRDGHSELP